MTEISRETTNGIKKKLVFYGFFHALCVAVYASLIAFMMTNGENWFGPATDFWGPALILMLLCLSAAVVGSLIFIRPALWVLDGRKKEALILLLYTLGWLTAMVIAAFLILAQTNR